MFGISKRSPPARAPTRSEQVRTLWVEFEVWHTARHDEIESKIQAALKELEQKWRSTKSRRQKKDPKELEEQKTKTRLELEKTLDGNMIRQEWDKRLRDAGLQSEDWIDMTEEEQRKVEMILGADLELEEVEEAPRISETYAVVDPTSFHLADNWMEVKQTLRSDDQLSLEASTASSISSTSDLWSTPVYPSWSSEASRSSAQSSQASSPEWQTKYLASDTSSSSSHPSTSASSQSRPKSHGQYIGPQLASDSEADDDEASFEKFKLSTRIKKIREFHEEAAEADIRLTLDLDEARRKKSWSKDEEAQRVRAHEADMFALRERKESERKADVDAERTKRRAELRPQLPTEQDFDSKAQKFLKDFHFSLERDVPIASETPTIRQSAFPRTRKQSLQHLHQQDWAESGNDTPTPTTRSSGWSFKKEKSALSGSGVGASHFGDAPPLKRLATAPAAVASASKTVLPHSSSVEEEEYSIKVSKDQIDTALPQSKKAAQTATPVSGVSVPVPISISKKSKKEKAKAGKKVAAPGIERTDSSEETPQRADDTSPKIPGHWGWGENPSHASSSTAEASSPWAGFSSSFTPTPSTLSSSTVASSSSHPLYTTHTPTPAASTSTLSFAPAPTATLATAAPHTSQVPDNRRVWIPPAALEANLNNKNRDIKAKHLEVPIPVQKSVSGPSAGSAQGKLPSTSNALFDVPTQIQKSVSGPSEFGAKIGVTTEGSRGGQTQAKPTENGREVHEPLTNGVTPGSSSSKPASAAPAKAPVAKPAIVVAPPLTKSSSSSSTSSKKKSKGKKKVTIEEAQDEELGLSDEDKARGIERLPVDYRYIMESVEEPKAPKPVVSEPQAQEMFRGVFEYGDKDSSPIPAASMTSDNPSRFQPARQQHDTWVPPAPAPAPASTSSSTSSSTLGPNDRSRWVPGTTDSTKKQEKQEKKVRWTQSAYAYDAPEPKSEVEDVFLSALDSLEAVIRGEAVDAVPSGVASSGPGVESGRWGMKNKKAQSKGRAAVENSDERLWQHTLSSLGRGGSNISATSVI
ncbi:hypothetical protein GYMLUDRAFT_53225 [Collybiopsis luxurians FD-317 M1]|nr:hypothetical protein GYMLUDRAFT_53225 [Collybiopsis luxurians FD-317 M1]